MGFLPRNIQGEGAIRKRAGFGMRQARFFVARPCKKGPLQGGTTQRGGAYKRAYKVSWEAGQSLPCFVVQNKVR
jgi:hypothetical protein